MNKFLNLRFESDEWFFINKCSNVVITTPVSFHLNIDKLLKTFFLSNLWSDVIDVCLIAIPIGYFLGIWKLFIKWYTDFRVAWIWHKFNLYCLIKCLILTRIFSNIYVIQSWFRSWYKVIDGFTQEKFIDIIIYNARF